MAIDLSLTEIERTAIDLKHALNSQLDLEPNEAFLIFPASFGNGYLRSIRLREGLDLSVQEYVLKQDLFLSGENFSLKEACASLTFCIAGQFSSTFPGIQSDITMGAQEVSFHTTPYAAGTIEFKAGEHIHLVDVTLSPILMLSLIGQELAELPQNLQQAIQSGATQSSIHFSDASADMAQALKKIIHCPYRGKIRSVYLEGQVLELIALYFSQFSSSSEPLPSALSRHQDINRLHEGREILKQNLITPPSLAELSEQLGLSERKLQQGFRELFGTTVFGVLHNDRMERARQLLETQQMSVGAIADMVGIAHRGYFARAFKRKFGSTPREYLKRFE